MKDVVTVSAVPHAVFSGVPGCYCVGADGARITRVVRINLALVNSLRSLPIPHVLGDASTAVLSSRLNEAISSLSLG